MKTANRDHLYSLRKECDRQSAFYLRSGATELATFWASLGRAAESAYRSGQALEILLSSSTEQGNSIKACE